MDEEVGNWGGFLQSCYCGNILKFPHSILSDEYAVRCGQIRYIKTYVIRQYSQTLDILIKKFNKEKDIIYKTSQILILF